MKTQKSNSSRKIILLFIVFTLLIGGFVYGIVAKNKDLWPFMANKSNSPTSESNSATDSINYNPPTDQEIQEGQDAKKRIIESSEEDETSSVSTKTTVGVGVAFADIVDGKLEIRAFTPNIIEGDGLCTAELKKDGATVTESSLAFIDSTTSQCRPIYISVDRFQSEGVWSLIVSYESETSIGESPSMEINI